MAPPRCPHCGATLPLMGFIEVEEEEVDDDDDELLDDDGPE